MLSVIRFATSRHVTHLITLLGVYMILTAERVCRFVWSSCVCVDVDIKVYIKIVTTSPQIVRYQNINYFHSECAFQ